MTALDGFRSAHGLVGDGPRLISQTARRSDLARLFYALGYTRGAEIGVWEGNYSRQLCEMNPGLDLIAVDPWTAHPEYREVKNDQRRLDAAYATARRRLEPFHCRLMRMMSVEAAAQVPDGSLDFAYIDANHARAAVEADLAAWVPKVRPGGIVSGHDFQMNGRKPWIEVPEAVTAFTSSHQIAPWFVLAGDKSPSWFWVNE